MWQSGPWSPCSRTCGGGLQFRTVQCVMRFSERNMTQDVPASFCESAKVRKPSSRRTCGEESCYSWIKSPWSPCSSGDCLSRNKGTLTVLELRYFINDVSRTAGTVCPLYPGQEDNRGRPELPAGQQAELQAGLQQHGVHRGVGAGGVVPGQSQL